jgi:hypothetical protein
LCLLWSIIPPMHTPNRSFLVARFLALLLLQESQSKMSSLYQILIDLNFRAPFS